MRPQRIAAEYTRPVRHRPQRVAGFNEAAANRCGIRLRSDRRRGPGQAASMRPQRIGAEYLAELWKTEQQGLYFLMRRQPPGSEYLPNESPYSNPRETGFNEAAANRCGIRRQ